MVRSFVFLLACSLAAPAFAGAPVLQTNGQRVPGEYLVAFKSAFAMRPASREMQAMGADVLQTWAGVNGAHVRLSADQLAAAAQLDGVAWIEEVSTYYVQAAQNRTIAAAQRTGLFGIDSIDGVRDGRVVAPANGAGVDVYVIDTGIQPAHVQFTGRLVRGTSTVNDNRTTDCNGHGTHVSGSAVGSTFGVAPGATLRDVRVFTCAGSTTNAAIINGVNFARTQATARGRNAVANMSLGGGASPMLDQVVNALANEAGADVFVAVAAGNSNVNAATTSPARAAGAFAVGASTINNTRASFSNFGTTVKIFAPGQNILSSWFRNANDTNTISGTSMASPHVAGAAALLRERNPNLPNGDIGDLLVRNATVNQLTGNLGAGSPNRFLNIAR